MGPGKPTFRGLKAKLPIGQPQPPCTQLIGHPFIVILLPFDPFSGKAMLLHNIKKGFSVFQGFKGSAFQLSDVGNISYAQ
jgi:hypothetical protein